MKNIVEAFMFLYFVYGMVGGQLALAHQHEPLICAVEGSEDGFKVYPEQLVYSSDGFLYYQLIDGLTVLVVSRDTMRFNRLSNLNLLKHSTMDPSRPPENYQMFTGTCTATKELNDSKE